jgi:hypothetical protein
MISHIVFRIMSFPAKVFLSEYLETAEGEKGTCEEVVRKREWNMEE